MPSAAQLAQHVGQRLLFLVAQAGGRLVEQQQRRVGAQRARDLHQALRAERQVAGQLVHLVGHADAPQLALGLGEQALLLGAVEPQHRRGTPLACRAGGAPSATFSSTVMSGIIFTCWKVRDTPRPRDLARRQAADRLRRATCTAPRVSGSTPVTG